eukprot:gene37326-50499_t
MLVASNHTTNVTDKGSQVQLKAALTAASATDNLLARTLLSLDAGRPPTPP